MPRENVIEKKRYSSEEVGLEDAPVSQEAFRRKLIGGTGFDLAPIEWERQKLFIMSDCCGNFCDKGNRAPNVLRRPSAETPAFQQKSLTI